MDILKEELLLRADGLFKTEEGKKALSVIDDTVGEFGMEESILSGTVVGFSGGADSVLLLLYLYGMRKTRDFPLAALHVNHMIRGDEADRDERFCVDFAEALGIPVKTVRVDVPKIAAERRIGIEECARYLRYEALENVINENDGIKCLAVAHNATDNLETVIFNLMRGGGTLGVSGIAPTRDNIVRPLIHLSKRDILSLLNNAKIPYVTDSTNFQTEYTRNYIRYEILPKLENLTGDPEAAVTRASRNLRTDAEFILEESSKFLINFSSCGAVSAKALADAHKALCSGAVRLLAKNSGCDVQQVHLCAIRSLLLRGGDFSVDLPNGKRFVCRSGSCRIVSSDEKENEVSEIPQTVLHDGVNLFDDYCFAILISDSKATVFSSNVYKFSIQVSLSSAIIYGNMSIRSRKDGDSYYYGGMTHKLKKLFNDKKIPKEERCTRPVVCDEKGILWVEGFGVRDDGAREGSSQRKWLSLYKRNKDEAK